MSEIRNLNPECIWRNFDALTQVPRPSGHLEKVQQFLLDFAAKRQHRYAQAGYSWNGEPQRHHIAGTHGHGAAEGKGKQP